MCKTAKDIWQSLLITHQGNSQVKDNKIDLLVQQYEQFTILEEESIDSGFARFNTIITSLKALDEGFSSKNYVRKFLRALHPKWRAKCHGKRILNLKRKKENIKSMPLNAKKISEDENLRHPRKVDDKENCYLPENIKSRKKLMMKRGLMSSIRQMRVEESLNVTLNENPPPTKLSPLVDDDIGEEEAIENNIKVVNNNNIED
ncbi:hypothetical protein Tco_1212699 [Tanacetum coccineum]